jgi:hypothetical protein
MSRCAQRVAKGLPHVQAADRRQPDAGASVDCFVMEAAGVAMERLSRDVGHWRRVDSEHESSAVYPRRLAAPPSPPRSFRGI